MGVAVSPGGGIVYVADRGNYRVQYFGPTGSFLGKWGQYGYGNGQFVFPQDVDLTPAGTRAYVADTDNERIQYFTSDEAVPPASLGQIKALFK